MSLSITCGGRRKFLGYYFHVSVVIREEQCPVELVICVFLIGFKNILVSYTEGRQVNVRDLPARAQPARSRESRPHLPPARRGGRRRRAWHSDAPTAGPELPEHLGRPRVLPRTESLVAFGYPCYNRDLNDYNKEIIP